MVLGFWCGGGAGVAEDGRGVSGGAESGRSWPPQAARCGTLALAASHQKLRTTGAGPFGISGNTRSLLSHWLRCLTPPRTPADHHRGLFVRGGRSWGQRSGVAAFGPAHLAAKLDEMAARVNVRLSSWVIYCAFVQYTSFCLTCSTRTRPQGRRSDYPVRRAGGWRAVLPVAYIPAASATIELRQGPSRQAKIHRSPHLRLWQFH